MMVDLMLSLLLLFSRQVVSNSCDSMDCSTPDLPAPHSLSIELGIPSDHLILSQPLLLPLIFPSIGVFSNESAFLAQLEKKKVCVCVNSHQRGK